ncbi:MAG TPA: laccase domain-containing protein, partial [Cellvibrionaceae bacterium]|nr:laccase domain-containing protein [Cellvibrionaceae bacterium]
MLAPDWPAPAQVKAVITQAQLAGEAAGFSQPPYGEFNLATHVGEAIERVAANRQLLSARLGIGPVQWVEQVHGTEVFSARWPIVTPAPVADGVYTATPGLPIAVLTADCLPVLLCTEAGDEVAAAHAGWRGLAQGVLAQTLNAFRAPAKVLIAYLGPAIGPAHFEVGEEVLEVFRHSFAPYGDVGPCFVPGRPGHYLADLYRLAR